MLLNLLGDALVIVGLVIEVLLIVAAIVLLILVLKFGVPKFQKKERQPKPEPEKYILKYVAGEGTGESPEVEMYRKGAKVTLKYNMFVTPTDKQFDGWSDGEKKYNANSKFIMPEQAVTLTAQWVAIEKPAEPAKYTLKYVAGEGSGEEPMQESYEYGTKVVLKSNMFVKPADKQFDGWSDGTVKYGAKDTLVMPAQSVTLTAQWKAVKQAKPAEEVKSQPEEQKADEQQPAQQIDGGTTADGKPIIVNVYNTTPANNAEKEVATTRTEEAKPEEREEDEVEFANYTILELYDLLSDEQKKYFDALKEAALAKPQAKMTVGRSFFNIKIGKRSILKLRIRRLITVGEYSLENDILKDFRKHSDNKAGNSKIKVRPTLVAVTDEATLETAMNMIDLVYKQILEN